MNGLNKKIVETENLCFAYNSWDILKNINLSVSKGEIVGIIGPNGAGKSTLIKLLAGLYEAGDGSIRIQQKNIRNYGRKELARQIGYVPQSIDLFHSFSVREIIAMGRFPHLAGFRKEDANAAMVIERAIQQMDLEQLQHRSLRDISGGEQQRAIIASAIAQEAPLFLLDEPTSALDLEHQQKIYRLLKDLAENQERTIVIVTHDINLAAQFCSRLIMLDKGKVVAEGKPEMVLEFNLIQKVYGIKVYIDVNPFTGSLYILPYDTN